MQQPRPNQNMPQNQPAPHQSQPPEHKFDNINKLKQLSWPLKESLATVMRVAGATIYHNSAVDFGIKNSDQTLPRFDQSLEDFYDICDRIELTLKACLDEHNQAKSSQVYSPIPVSPAANAETPHGQDVISYSQYVSNAKSQVRFAKELQTYLSNWVNSES